MLFRSSGFESFTFSVGLCASRFDFSLVLLIIKSRLTSFYVSAVMYKNAAVDIKDTVPEVCDDFAHLCMRASALLALIYRRG